ncbi:MAG: LamG domain-containing protein [Candidatus Marinimicrobia bacterium]|nr:LamG domain-containing protein [Candidatus Neomarinimicrobiota bacterium]
MAGLNSDTKLLSHFEDPISEKAVDGAFEIIDSGNTGHIITQVGTAQLSTAQKKFGSSSLLLDGDSDYVTAPDSADWTFGTGFFTIDFWVRFNAFNDHQRFITHFEDGSNKWIFSYTNLTNTIEFYNYVGASFTVDITASWTPAINTWYHVTVIRKGLANNNTDWAFGIDGTLKTGGDLTLAAGAWNGTVSDFTGNLQIGYDEGLQWVDGYMSEVRVSKGVARWTTNFTPSTVPYTSDADTQLLLHMNTQDVSGDGGSDAYHIPTFVGTAQLDTAVKKWGAASALFDGDSDYITFPDSADWDLVGSNADNWTIDFWVKHVDHAGTESYIGQSEGAAPTNYWVIIHDNGNGLKLQVYSGGGAIIDTGFGGEITDTDWHHIALCKVADEYAIYLDGAQVNYVQDSSTDTFTAPLVIGATDFTGSFTNFFNGNMDEPRIQKSNYFGAVPVVGLTDTITVPTAAYSVSIGLAFQVIMF